MRRFLWITFLTIDALVLCAFGFGYVARWLDPRVFWWPQLFGVALPFTSLGVAAATLILLFRKKWGSAALHLACLLLVSPRFFSLSSAPHPRATSATEGLRTVSYNMGGFDNLTPEALTGQMNEVLRWVHPDVFCMQELSLQYEGRPDRGIRIDNVPRVVQSLDSLGFELIARESHRVKTTLQPVATRKTALAMRTKEQLLITEANRELRIVRTLIRWRGRDAILYNVHLRTFGGRKPWREQSLHPLMPSFWSVYLSQYRRAFLYRAWQAEKLRAYLDRESLPVIVAGDFNSTPHNWVFHHIGLNLRDAFAEAGMKRAFTYHSRFPVARIDHVLVSDEWHVYEADVLPFAYSDHQPILVVLGWK